MRFTPSYFNEKKPYPEESKHNMYSCCQNRSAVNHDMKTDFPLIIEFMFCSVPEVKSQMRPFVRLSASFHQG
jgi:hypothetical protein